MKKILFALTIIFAILTFAGAIYVIKSNGSVNAGYAVVPSLISIVCSNGYRRLKNKK